MESRKQHKPNLEEEIDLVEMLAKGILIVKKNFAFFLIAFVVGSGLGLAYYQFTPKIYESKMVINSDILTESYCKSVTDNFTKLIKEENFQVLSEKLSLTDEQSRLIRGIEIKSAIEKAGDLPENAKTVLIVDAKSIDNTIWLQLQNGIITYLQNIDFVKIRVEQKKKYINQMIEKVNFELVDLEKLKTKIAEGYLAQSKESLVLFDPTTVNSKIIELNKEKINLQNSIETVNSVQLLEGFTIFKKPASPKLSISLVSGSFFGMLFVAAIILIKFLRLVVNLSEQKLN